MVWAPEVAIQTDQEGQTRRLDRCCQPVSSCQCCSANWIGRWASLGTNVRLAGVLYTPLQEGHWYQETAPSTLQFSITWLRFCEGESQIWRGKTVLLQERGQELGTRVWSASTCLSSSRLVTPVSVVLSWQIWITSFLFPPVHIFRTPGPYISEIYGPPCICHQL